MEKQKIVELSECCIAPTVAVLDANNFVSYWICSSCKKPAMPFTEKFKDPNSGIEFDIDDGSIIDWAGTTRDSA